MLCLEDTERGKCSVRLESFNLNQPPPTHYWHIKRTNEACLITHALSLQLVCRQWFFFFSFSFWRSKERFDPARGLISCNTSRARVGFFFSILNVSEMFLSSRSNDLIWCSNVTWFSNPSAPLLLVISDKSTAPCLINGLTVFTRQVIEIHINRWKLALDARQESLMKVLLF